MADGGRHARSARDAHSGAGRPHGRVLHEGGIFGQMVGRYNESASNLDIYLKGFSGDATRTDRVSRQSHYIKETILTIVLTVQPSVVRDLARNPRAP